MKNVSILIISLLFAVSISAQDTLQGRWLTGEENTIVETYQKEGKWQGKIVASDNPNAKIGTHILQDFEKKEGLWIGKIFAIKRGKLLDATIKPEDDALQISVSAGFITKELKWEKVKE